MRRAALTGLVALATAAGGSGVASGASQPPRASLVDPICQRASDALDRLVAISAEMRPLAGTESMELQFNLREKKRGARSYTTVTGGDLGKWLSPQNPSLGQRPGDVWKLQKQVVNLPGPAIYRFHVGFDWIGSRGHSLGREYKWAAPCNEP